MEKEVDWGAPVLEPVSMSLGLLPEVVGEGVGEGVKEGEVDTVGEGVGVEEVVALGEPVTEPESESMLVRLGELLPVELFKREEVETVGDGVI